MNPMVLYGRPNSANVQKVMWCLGELELEHQQVFVGGEYGTVAESGLLRLNPNGLVPFLSDGDQVIWESHVIVRYLVSKYSYGTVSQDPFERALSDRWMDWYWTSLAAPMTVINKGILRKDPSVEPSALVAAVKSATDCWAILSATLADSPFISGDGIGMADFAIGIALHRWMKAAVSASKFSNLTSLYERYSKRPPYRNTVGE